MNFKTWTPLWSTVVDSSIWDEEDHVLKVFLTMLALKDADHVVRLNAYQIGKRSRKTEAEVLDALKVLSSPDTRRLEKQDFGGRRIQSVEEGWLILNGEKYREQVKLEMRRARNRRAQATYREKQKKEKSVSGAYLENERRFVKAVEAGDERKADEISGEGL